MKSKSFRNRHPKKDILVQKTIFTNNLLSKKTQNGPINCKNIKATIMSDQINEY